MHRVKFCSVLFVLPVDACCHKKVSCSDCLCNKQSPLLSAINYFTLTREVIDPKARFFALPLGGLHRNYVVRFGMEK